MSDDLLNVESTERVDLEDFIFAVDESKQLQTRQLMAQFLTDPVNAPSYAVIDGFEIDCPSGKQLRVTRGRAILGQREEGVPFQSVLTTEGDAEKIVDMTSGFTGIYSIYIRFEYVDSVNEVRTFWDPSGGGNEFVQAIPTRRVANWGLRVESTSPGAEWFKIGEVNQATLAPTTSGITDQRDLYFEGNVSTTYANTWGSGNDRNNDRQQYGIKDMRTFVNAVKTMFEDLKNSKRWWVQSGAYGEGRVTGEAGIIGQGHTGSNAEGGIFQANGNASGVLSVGGATNGLGGEFYGGTGSTGDGVYGSGGSTGGRGGRFVGDGGAVGVRGEGDGAAAGVEGVGGGTAGDGVTGTGGAGNSRGVLGTGSGTGSGVVGTGGPSSGTGVAGTGGAPNGVGSQGSGTGTGDGVRGIGGSTSGLGVRATGGLPDGNGGTLTGNGVGWGVKGLTNGFGYGVVAQGPPDPSIGSGRGSLFITPQQATPATGEQGAVWIHNQGGKAQIHNGTSWDKAVVQSDAIVATSTQLNDSTLTEQAFDTTYTIPANTMKVGSTIRFRANVQTNNLSSSTQDVVIQLKLGGVGGIALATFNYINVGTLWTQCLGFSIDVTVTVRASGNFSVTGTSSGVGLGTGESFVKALGGTGSGITVGIANTIGLTIDFSETSSNTAQVASQVIDIL